MHRRAFLEAGLAVPLAGVASAQSSTPARQTIVNAYYPRNIQEPDRNMRIIATHVKQYLQG